MAGDDKDIFISNRKINKVHEKNSISLIALVFFGREYTPLVSLGQRQIMLRF